MGATSWHDDILQALLIGFVVQIVVSIFCVFWAFLCAFGKERMARPATGESMTECDVEMGTVNVGEGATILGLDMHPWTDNPPHGLDANSGVGDGGKLEDTEDVADTTHTRASTSSIPTVHGSSTQGPVQEDVKRIVVPVVVDVSHTQQVGEVLIGKEA